VIQPAAPQFVIATDMRNPPGVIMWRNGACAVTAAMVSARGCASAAANPRSSTAPSVIGSVSGVRGTASSRSPSAARVRVRAMGSRW
jgi:hypothetical protein